MKNKLMKSALILSALLSSAAFAQTGGTPTTGFIGYMNNLEGQLLYLVGFVMVAMGVAGVIFAYMAVMTFKDNVSDSPQSGQPEWGKFAGQFIFAAATLGGSGWIYSITTAFNGGSPEAGAGSKVRDRYSNSGG
jgi:hypothetical protein